MRKKDRALPEGMTSRTGKIGKRGSIVLPADLRRRYGLDEGALVLLEEQDGGILIRPAAVVPLEIYTPQRKAEFLLSNAVDLEDYQHVRETVRQMGLNPDTIPHRKPHGE